MYYVCMYVGMYVRCTYICYIRVEPMGLAGLAQCVIAALVPMHRYYIRLCDCVSRV